ALQAVVRESLSCDSLTLEIEGVDESSGHRVYRHAHPPTPIELRREHPARNWFARHPGAPAYRLSDIVPLRKLRGTHFHENVMQREGWDKLLGIVSWNGGAPQGTLNLFRGPAQPDFSQRELRTAESLQPHFHTALMRVLAHEA